MRHVLEFYRCFLDGLDSSHIDYDSRRRDESIERSRHAASIAITSIIHALGAHAEQERIVWVRMEARQKKSWVESGSGSLPSE